MDRNLSDRRKRSDATGSRHRRWLYSIALLVTLGLVSIPVLQAVHADGFQLDGDIATQVTTPATHDWTQVYTDFLAGNTSTSGADAIAFAHEGHRQFTIGGSKDIQNTTSWNWKNGDKQDKDDILDAMAARYGSTLYFGADRFAINGDAQMGFWFFQKNIGPVCADGSAPSNCTTGTFGPDAHKDGDILVLSDFTQGGAATFIRVYQWCGTFSGAPNQQSCISQGANSNLLFLEGSDTISQDCVKTPLPNDDDFCATVNSAGINNVPWPYTPKSNTGSAGGGAQKIPIGAFYEGGIDLAFLHLENECFASFMAETRASQTPDATLSEFEGGSFEKCEASVKTTPTTDGGTTQATSITLGTTINDYALITGTGSNQAPTGTMTFFICSPTQLDDPNPLPGTNTPDDPNTCDVGGTQVGNAVTVTASNPLPVPPTSYALSAAATPDAIGTWCFRGVYSGDSKYPGTSDSSTGECFTVVAYQSHIATEQIWSVYDKATVTVASAAGTVNGNVVFKLYNNSDCSGAEIFKSTKPISDAASPAQAQSDTYPSSGGAASATYKWQVTYTPSSRPAQIAATGTCGNENTVITITNGGTEPQ